MVACVSYAGLHILDRESDVVLGSFGFHKIVAWQALEHAAVISVVSADFSGSKMMKLHLLSDESSHLTSLLSRYGRRVRHMTTYPPRSSAF